MHIATALLLPLGACGGPGEDPAVLPAGAPTQIATLERSGVVPRLDRSTDIAGPDVNRNGVRDDIEAWIDSRPVSDIQRKALMQTARALQSTLLADLENEAALNEGGERSMAAAKCGGSRFVPATDFYRLAGKIEGMTANTRERAKRYMEYNIARSGTSVTSPTGDACEP